MLKQHQQQKPVDRSGNFLPLLLPLLLNFIFIRLPPFVMLLQVKVFPLHQSYTLRPRSQVKIRIFFFQETESEESFGLLSSQLLKKEAAALTSSHLFKPMNKREAEQKRHKKQAQKK